MSNLRFNIVPNPFKDQEYSKYDYIGQFITNGTKTLDESTEALAEGRSYLDATFVKMVVGLLFDVIAEEIADNYRCTIGGIAFESAISGSLPAANSPFSEENELYVAVRVGDPIRSAVAALEPTKNTEDVTKASVSDVEDKTSHEVGVIHGTSTVIVTGKNISASLEGESIVLADINTGVTKSVGTVVSTEGHGQRIEVNFAAPFDAGRYRLILATRGYLTPDADVETCSKKVTALAATAPAITLVKCGDLADNVVKFENGAVYVTLANYTPQDGDKLFLEAIKDGAVFENFEVTDQKTASAANLITFASGIENTSEKSNAEWVQYGKRFYLKRGTAEYEKIVTFVA